MKTEHTTEACPICREMHEPRGLSFDGKGINSCGMYRARLATFTEEGIKTELGDTLAAAPDLLEALKAGLTWWHSDVRRMNQHEPEWLTAARLAIQKATGE